MPLKSAASTQNQAHRLCGSEISLGTDTASAVFLQAHPRVSESMSAGVMRDMWGTSRPTKVLGDEQLAKTNIGKAIEDASPKAAELQFL